MGIELANFVTVLRTGQLIHLDWASNALEEAGIPYQRREESSGGIRLAMPATPSTGPGTWWVVMVPESFVTQAREVSDGLPFEQDATPDIWDFQPKRGGKLGWQIYAWFVVGSIAIGIIMEFISVLR